MSKINKTDNENFRAAMTSVRPLKYEQRHRDDSIRPSRSGAKRNTAEDDAATSTSAENSAIYRQVHDASSQALPLLRDGLPRKTLRRMGSKQCPVADSFDLHGMKEKAAAQALNRFLVHALQDDLECIRIIHGKGLRSDGPPVLKLMSWKLLWQNPSVLALKPCAPDEGGNGAVLVLLRPGDKSRREITPC